MSSGARGAARERLASASEAIAGERQALKARARALAGAVPVQPLALLHAIGEMLPKDAVVIEGDALLGAGHPAAHQQRRSAELFRAARRRHRLGLAGGDRRQACTAGSAVVALIGDGSAMYTVQVCGPRRATASTLSS